jgi:uncharacterized protein (DUF433 family)
MVRLGSCSPSLHPSRYPVERDSRGVLRLTGSRVTLDVVVAAFDAGQTPEEIAQQYPSLDLGAVYAVVAYLLRHRSEIDAYLIQRTDSADAVRAENERRFPGQDVRDRLLRRAERS